MFKVATLSHSTSSTSTPQRMALLPVCFLFFSSLHVSAPCSHLPLPPVREKAEDRNERIKEHYWKLWGLGDANGQGPSTLQADAVFEGEQVVIDREQIQEFCKGAPSQVQAALPFQGCFVCSSPCFVFLPLQSLETSKKATKASPQTVSSLWTLPSSSAGSPSPRCVPIRHLNLWNP